MNKNKELLQQVAGKLKDKVLFPERVERVKEYLAKIVDVKLVDYNNEYSISDQEKDFNSHDFNADIRKELFINDVPVGACDIVFDTYKVDNINMYGIRIYALEIYKEHRGKVFGKVLLDKAIERVFSDKKELGFSELRVRLAVSIHNDVAISLYESYGFNKIIIPYTEYSPFPYGDMVYCKFVKN